MILPTKGVPASKALITVGGEVLQSLGDSSLTMSGLWLQISEYHRVKASRISYDWFVLALDLLYSLGALELTPLGLIRRTES